jgi:hypothetical protein
MKMPNRKPRSQPPRRRRSSRGLSLQRVSVCIPTPVPEAIGQLESFWRTTNPGLASCEDHAWGEGSAGTQYKIWEVINRRAPLDKHSRVGDWGSGAAKMLIAHKYFARLPEPGQSAVPVVGVEKDPVTFARGVANLRQAGFQPGTPECVTLNCDSTLIPSWDGLTHVLLYDGGPRHANSIQEYHQTIMTNVFATDSVRCVFSTQLTPVLFRAYFGTMYDWKWRLYVLGGMNWGNSHYQGYLYVKTKHI